jgi:hypothetical protein
MVTMILPHAINGYGQSRPGAKSMTVQVFNQDGFKVFEGNFAVSSKAQIVSYYEQKCREQGIDSPKIVFC